MENDAAIKIETVATFELIIFNSIEDHMDHKQKFKVLDQKEELDPKLDQLEGDMSPFDGEAPIEIKKWGSKGKLVPSYYFQPLSTIDPEQLRMTNISIYSTTPWKEANCISRTIVNFFGGKPPIAPLNFIGGKPPLNFTDGGLWEKPPLNFIDVGGMNKGGAMGVSPTMNKGGAMGVSPRTMGGSLTITDATANIGGNTISFYLNGFTVNAVEKDELTCQILKHNLNVYKLPIDSVHCCDYLSIYKDLKQDVVFLDPPWGGPDYKKINQLDLYLGENPPINIIDICAGLFEEKKVSLIALKLPINYNLSGLLTRLPKIYFLTQKIYRHHNHSYNVIYLWGNFAKI